MQGGKELLELGRIVNETEMEMGVCNGPPSARIEMNKKFGKISIKKSVALACSDKLT